MLKRLLFAIIGFCLATAPASAEISKDLIGVWSISVDGVDDADYSGVASVGWSAEADDFTITLIMEDECCGGNYAKVKQKSTAQEYGEFILILSEIEEFLIRDEPNPGTRYNPDDFRLEWVDQDTLKGINTGGVPVIWKRENAGLV